MTLLHLRKKRLLSQMDKNTLKHQKIISNYKHWLVLNQFSLAKINSQQQRIVSLFKIHYFGDILLQVSNYYTCILSEYARNLGLEKKVNFLIYCKMTDSPFNTRFPFYNIMCPIKNPTMYNLKEVKLEIYFNILFIIFKKFLLL